jgi:hypothetical protein
LAHLWRVTRWAASRRHGGLVARKQIAPQVLEKARFAEENGSRRKVDTDVRIFSELQKNEPKRLKSLSRAQNRALRETVDLLRDSGSHR